MSDEDPKPGVVIDVEPDDEHAARGDDPSRSQSGAAAKARTPARRGRLALALAVLALLAVATAGLFGYRYWSDMVQQLAAMDTRVHDASRQQQTLQQSLDEATAALRAQEAALAEQRELLSSQRAAVEEARTAFEQQEQMLADENLRLQEREGELRAAVADVHRRVGRSGTQWIIAEAEYLLRIANHRLSLARDVETAQVALELADQRLRDTRDPGWAGVREQIARDIAQLSTFEAPDLSGLSNRLAALIDQIPQLKIAGATVGPGRALPETPARDPEERSWDTLLDDLLAGFKDTVRIRKRDQPVQAMLAPEHQYFLYENLKLQLEAARLGLARNDQALFRDNLDTAAQWLDAYFEADERTAQAIATAIAEMRRIDIRPELPDISQSLRALRARRGLLQDAAPAGDPGQ